MAARTVLDLGTSTAGSAVGPGLPRYLLWQLVFINTLPTGLTAATSGSSSIPGLIPLAQMLLPAAAAYLILLRRIYQGSNLGGRFLAWLLVYCVATFLPLFLNFSTVGAARSIRLVVVAVLCYYLASDDIVLALRAYAHFAVGLVTLALTTSTLGINSWPGGRLGGFFPPLHPNALGAIVSIGAVVATSFAFYHPRRGRWITGAALLVLGTLLTGSRTSIAVLAFALAASILVYRHGSSTRLRGSIIPLMATIAVGGAALLIGAWSQVLDFITRNGTSTVDGSFSGRTYAWRAALSHDTDLAGRLFGGGLGIRAVAVQRSFVDTQGIDGTFFAAYVQVGLLGTTILLVGILALCIRFARQLQARRPTDGVLFVIVSSCFVLSFTESVLNDVSPVFALLVVACARADMVVLPPTGHEAGLSSHNATAAPAAQHLPHKVKGSEFRMSSIQHLRLLVRNWWIVAGCIVLTTSSAAMMTYLSKPVYESRTRLFAALHDNGSAIAAYQGGQFSVLRVKSYAQIVTSPAVTAPVIEQLRLDVTPEQLASQISARAPQDTVLIDIVVKDPSPQRAHDIAAAVATRFSEVVEGLEAPEVGATGTTRAEPKDANPVTPVTVRIVEPATMPAAPVSPRKDVNLALGLLAGLAFGVAAAVLRESLDTSVKDDADLASLTDSPVLGSIGFDRDAVRQPLVPIKGGRSIRAEHYRSLRTNLRFVDIDAPPRCVVLTSSVSLEGKSITSCNLALTLAGSGSRTVLVEGDLRRPSISNYMGLEGSVGLTDVLVGRVALLDALQPWGDTDLPLHVLPSGALPPNPSELLDSANMEELLAELRERADFVIVDAPPLLAVTDAAILAKAADGALVVVRHGKTPRTQIRRAFDALAHVDAKVLGTVLNMVPTSGPRRGRYGAYGYGYHSEAVPPAASAGAAGAPEPRAAESADQRV